MIKKRLRNTVLISFVLVFSILANNIKDDNSIHNKYLKQQMYPSKQGLTKNELSKLSSLPSQVKNLYKANSHYALSEEIIEVTPPSGELFRDKNEYVYDENENNSQILRYTWDNEDWVLQSRGNLTYDEFNREIELLNEFLQNSSWVEWFRQTTTYNEQGLLASITGAFNGQFGWENSWRQLNYYDENNNLISSKLQWAEENVWYEADIRDYIYNSNGLLVDETVKSYDNGVWINVEQYAYSYDEAGQLIEMIQKYWNGEAWDDYFKTELSYDENGYLISTLGYLNEDGNWRNNTRWTNEYDENKNNVMRLFEQNWDGSGWKVFEKVNNSFIQLLTSVDNFGSISEILSLEQNYPNPFNPTTTISYQIPQNLNGQFSNVQLVVNDILGNEIALLVNERQNPGNYKVDFDASELPSGVYFYRLQAGDFVETKKMILLK